MSNGDRPVLKGTLYGRGYGVDRDELHRHLWEIANHRGIASVSQRELAKDIGCTHFTLCGMFRTLCDQGKLVRLQTGNGKIIAKWRVARPEGAEPKSRQPVWG